LEECRKNFHGAKSHVVDDGDGGFYARADIQVRPNRKPGLKCHFCPRDRAKKNPLPKGPPTKCSNGECPEEKPEFAWKNKAKGIYQNRCRAWKHVMLIGHSTSVENPTLEKKKRKLRRVASVNRCPLSDDKEITEKLKGLSRAFIDDNHPHDKDGTPITNLATLKKRLREQAKSCDEASAAGAAEKPKRNPSRASDLQLPWRDQYNDAKIAVRKYTKTSPSSRGGTSSLTPGGGERSTA